VAAWTRGPRLRFRLPAGAVLLALSLPASASAACNTDSFNSADVPKSIPDPGSATSTLAVPAGAPVKDLDVHLDLTHPFDSDLRIELLPPTGPPVTLAEGVGTWGDDFQGTVFDDEAASSVISTLPPFTGHLRPAEPLSALDGSARAGTWKLRVTDLRGGYSGQLTDWGLDVTSCSDMSAPTGQAITGPSAEFQKKLKFAVSWAAGTDTQSGVASRDVHYWRASSEAGFGSTVDWKDTTTATSASLAGQPGSVYCFSERLRDGAGNESAFSTLKCTALPVNDPDLAHGPGWSELEGSGYYRGDYSQANTKGAELTLPVAGQTFALLATTCPNCGKVDVFLGSQHLRRISLVSKREHKRRLLPIKTFGSLRSGELRIVTLSKRKAIVDGVGVSRPAIQQLPDVYANAGAPDPPPLPTGVPSGAEGTVGTLITVDTNSDVSDGDVSTVANLQANPGADGEISLREAIEATNNDPGSYTIHFAPALEGATIDRTGEFPRLTGGGLFIDGDIDGDGQPDIAVVGTGVGWGFIISSSGNRLHAIAVQGVDRGVGLLNTTGGQTITGNVVSGLVMSNIHEEGITGFGGDAGQTDNVWTDTRIVGNSIESERGGIELFEPLADGVVERLTIAGNAIDIVGGSFSGDGIHLGAGGGAGGDGNRITDALLAYNSVAGDAQGGVGILSGAVGGSSNTVEGLRMIGNRIAVAVGRNVIGIAAGDVGTDFICPGCPVVYPEDNVVQDVEISGNVLGNGPGVLLGPGGGGATRNKIQNVEIARNVIRSVSQQPNHPGLWLGGDEQGAGGIFSRRTFDNELSNVSADHNTITVASDGDAVENAGVYVIGGDQSDSGTVQGVHVTANRIDTQTLGVHLLGGAGYAQPASDNVISGTQVRGNLVVGTPTPEALVDPQAKGIALTGGYGQSTGNSVSCVGLQDNIVAGVLNDVSVTPNVGGAASGNTASLGGC
jgi:subtilisin-like proprotein convertase family protein